MKRSFNYTGRIDLPRNVIRIRLADDGTFEAGWDLSEHTLPADAEVMLEALSSGSPEVLRFSYGTVATPKPPDDRRLTNIIGESLAFNFKVVDVGENAGKLLAVASGIQPKSANEEAAANQQSLLPVNPVDLGDQIWRLNFSQPRPVLEVNSKIENIMKMVREDRIFFALVFPSIIHQVLGQVLLVDHQNDPESNPDDPRTMWLRWGIHWHPDNERPEEGDPQSNPGLLDSWRGWIEEVVTAFCKRHGTFTKFNSPQGEEVPA